MSRQDEGRMRHYAAMAAQAEAEAGLEPLPSFPHPTVVEVLVDMTALLVDILKVQREILARLGQSGESRSSVELTVDSKAVVKPTVKVYDLDPALAANAAQLHFDNLVIKYGGPRA